MCINLRRAAQAVTAYYDGVLASCGISVTQFSLLRNLLRAGPCSVSDLAGHTGLERSTLARNLKALFAAGYIEDKANPGGRKRSLHVSPAGEQVLEKSLPLWERAQKAVSDKISAANVRVLTELLSLLESL
jgi:DNA-binding MarR family transcriptional regulator